MSVNAATDGSEADNSENSEWADSRFVFSGPGGRIHETFRFGAASDLTYTNTARCCCYFADSGDAVDANSVGELVDLFDGEDVLCKRCFSDYLGGEA